MSGSKRVLLGASWQLTRLIHRGAQAQVCRARLADNDLGPGCYAVKIPQRASDAIAAAMLRREGQVARDVEHAHVISVLATGRDADNYVVLPYLDGVSLRQLLRHRAEKCSPPIPLAKALGIVRQVAAGLSALHQAGWLHGQVRPEHVLVSPQGHTTLIDLTHARRLESSECDGGDEGLSPLYAAPERSLARCRLTGAADTYSLGILLFELLTGRPPFGGRDSRQVLALHRTAAPPDLRQLRPDASLECAQLVRRMLAKEPLRRPNGDEMLRWLTEIEIAELSL